MFQHTARCGTVGEEFCPYFSHTDGVYHHSDGAVANQTVKAQGRNEKHIRGVKSYGKILIFIASAKPR